MRGDLRLWFYLGIGILVLLSGIITLYKRRRRNRTIPKISPLTLGLEKTHHRFAENLKVLFLQSKLDDQVLANLEEILISADVGVQTTKKLLYRIKEDFDSFKAQDPSLLKRFLEKEILKILESPSVPSPIDQRPEVLMVVGVNGVGKTTSIAKLAAFYHRQNHRVLLAAADTFRAGAVDQLKVWGERINVAVLSKQDGSDPGAVAFDAVKAGEARGMDQVIIDTAGRLHTKANLMEELKKVRRVIDKAMPGAPHETLLVIDATQGQNALHQAREFHQALGVTGMMLTKLDGTAKGGMVIGIVDEIGVPIRFLGLGERLEDFQPFSATDFVEALLE
jgi:fused signal recognition particle receptor